MWNEAGATLLAIIPDALDISFRDARNETGTGSFTVPYDSSYGTPPIPARDLFARDLVVRFVEDGVPRFACVIEEDTVHMVDDQPRITVSGRGLLCWLERAMIYPLRGLRRKSRTDRVFGFGAGDVFAGALGSTWVAPQEEASTSIPANWPNTSIYRIWPSTIGSAPPGQRAWFYTSFTTTVGQQIRIDATGDDVVKVWMDDELLIDQDGTERPNPGVNMMTTVRKNLPAGVHWVMIYGQQLSVEDAADLGITGPGGAWVALRIATITGDDDNGTQLLRTGASGWLSTHEEPGWTPGFCVRRMVTEANTRGTNFGTWTTGFTNDEDSNGVPWLHNISKTWPVGTDYLKFVLDLAETGIDFWFTPLRVLTAAQSRGTDKSGSVYLFPSGNVTQYGVTRRHKFRTVAAVNTGEGWTEVIDPAESARGRMETRIDLTNVDSISQGIVIAGESLGALAAPVRETDGDNTSIIPWSGANPYQDFGLADIVSVPDGAGGTTTATVMAISYRGGDNGDQWSLELDLAQAGARSLTKLPDQRLLAIAQSGGAASAGGRIQSASK